jgi:hypothetical protein
MFYYIKNNGWFSSEEQITGNDLGDYGEMTEAERDFWQQYPYATTEEVLQQTLLYEDERQLSAARANKAQEISGAFDVVVTAGYYDATLDVTIRIANDDRNQFNQRITLLSLVPTAMKPAATTITDINGDPVTITLQEFFTLMLYMGMYYDSIWSRKAGLDKQIKDATTVEQINNITWS